MEYPHHSLGLAQATFSIPYKVLDRIPRMRSSLSQLACHLVSHQESIKHSFYPQLPELREIGYSAGYQRRNNVYIQDGIQGSRAMV